MFVFSYGDKKRNKTYNCCRCCLFIPLLLLLNSRCTSRVTGKTDLDKAQSICSLGCIDPRASLPLVQRRCVRRSYLTPLVESGNRFPQKCRDTTGEGFQIVQLSCELTIYSVHKPTWQPGRANRLSTPQEVEANHGSALLQQFWK